MFNAIVRFSVKKKLFVALTSVFLLIGGIYAMLTLPIDAVPDITNNQVQIVTVSPTLAPQEVEQLITIPVETSMSNIMNVTEIRSVSRFGLSLVTVVFKDNVPTLEARQLVNEQIQSVAGEIPSELGTPEMMPITTGLGEIYQYVLKVDAKHSGLYDAMELRTIQDWIVRRQLSGIPGIVEINSFGGRLKQYEIAVDPEVMSAMKITIGDVFEALQKNNQNTGASYIEKKNRAYYIRSEGMISKLSDIEKIVVANRNGMPVHVGDMGRVSFGSPKRFGAMTMDGKGECVGGIAMMLKGANANVVTKELERRIAKVQKMLPEGVTIEPYLNRSELVSRNISTVVSNLVEGAVIVFVVLLLFLGNVRASVIVASVIPMAMLFGFIMMRIFGVSANLMSLGAIDFGIVVDGSIVIIEGLMAHIYGRRLYGRQLTREEMDEEVIRGAAKVVHSSTFAVLIILIVFFPILTLSGIEGKYFTPMAQTLVFCIIGALLLSLTYVPMMAAVFLKRDIKPAPTFADRFFAVVSRHYRRLLQVCLRRMGMTIGVAFSLLAASMLLFTRLGAEFIPTLDEGDFAMQMTLPAGSSLTSSINLSLKAEKVLKEKFPEVKHVVAKIGTAEVPTDPMSVEDADVMIIMKPFREWTSASSREEMVEKMKEALQAVEGAEFNFSQPIQLRFNELMTGAKADIAIKLYGEDMDELYSKAKEAEKYVAKIKGASDVIVEQAVGLPQLVVKYNRTKIARYGVDIDELNTIIRTAYAGEAAGVVFENERRFDLVLRLDENIVEDLDLSRLCVRTSDGLQIPVSEVATIDLVNGPLQINRDAAKRRIVIGVNVRNADIQQVVEKISRTLDRNIKLKPGYYFEYGGQFENLQNAIDTLMVVIPIALMLILLILFFAFRSVTYTLVVFSTVPLSLVGGIAALWLRGLPFSISAGVGFIALFGVAVLNGILMINHFNGMKNGTRYTRCTHRLVLDGSMHLLRPVFLTGLVASLGFVPMAVATSAGAEVQRPLATVVIGGLTVSTVLTLIVIPVFYRLVNAIPVIMKKYKSNRQAHIPCLLIALACTAASTASADETVTLERAIQLAIDNSPRMRIANEEIVRTRAEKGESWEPGNTTVRYAWGQLNGEPKNDNEISVEQSLGSFVTPFYRNALVKTKVATGETQRELVRREITAEVKRAWTDCLYAISKRHLYDGQASATENLKRICRLRYEQGDITKLEYSMMNTLAAEQQTQANLAAHEMKLAMKRLAWVCRAKTPLMPADTALNIMAMPLATGVSHSHTDLFDLQAKQRDDMVKVERSKFFPEFSVGYARQKITPLTGLNSWTVGISFPLFFMPQKSRLRQAKADATMAHWQAEDSKAELRQKVEEARGIVARQAECLEYYTQAALAEAEELQRNAILTYESSETGMAELIQSLNTAREIRKNYIEAVYQYNIAVIELELYTE